VDIASNKHDTLHGDPALNPYEQQYQAISTLFTGEPTYISNPYFSFFTPLFSDFSCGIPLFSLLKQAVETSLITSWRFISREDQVVRAAECVPFYISDTLGCQR